MALLLLAALAAAAGCQQPTPISGRSLVIPVKSEPWTGRDFSGRRLLSRHYSIYTTSASPEIVGCLPGFMEAAYQNYLRLTGLPDRPLKKPMEVYMMATRVEWAALTRSVWGDRADVPLSIQAGGYCRQGVCVFWDMGGSAALSVASHEGLHQFFARRLRHSLPVWLEEGLCVLAEGYQLDGQSVRFTPRRNASRFRALRNAIVHDRWIPLAKLLPMDAGEAIRQLQFPEYVVGYYGQVWALAAFLRSDPRYGRELSRLLNDAEAGRLHAALKMPLKTYLRLRGRGAAYNRAVSVPLFRHYFNDDLTGFEQRYKAFARKLVKL